MGHGVNNNILQVLRTVAKKVEFQGDGIYTMEMENPNANFTASQLRLELSVEKKIETILYDVLSPIPTHWELQRILGSIKDAKLTVTIICT